jgi:acetate kinase
MTVLVLNCGSSSVKFRVLHGDDGDFGRAAARTLAAGALERIGNHPRLTFDSDDIHDEGEAPGVADHAAAIARVLDRLAQERLLGAIEVVGHRVVHGGGRFTGPALVDEGAVTELAALAALAPLHNGPSVAAIDASRRRLPAVPMVAVFDTAFHAVLPERAARYAIPRDLAARHQIRRYGFHGLAYRSVLARWPAVTGQAAETARLVALHLGSGCSAAAIDRGHPVDTSMGFTPLEGLVMGTRSGDVDPALVAHLAEREDVPAATVVEWLNERSGLLGLGGANDVRDLLAREATDPDARLALDIFCHRARKYVGAYLAVLGGADAVVFSGGIGERAPAVRARICAGLEWFGLALDPARNAAITEGDGRLSADGGRLAAWTIAADEAQVIAADSVACLRARAGGWTR